MGIWSENPDTQDSLDPYLLLVPQMETLVSVSWCEGSLDEFLPAQKWSISWSVGLSITYQPYESHYLAVELFCEMRENENSKKSTYMIMDWSDRRKGKNDVISLFT